MTGHDKRRIALRYWLLGRGWTAAAEALTFAETRHRGWRRDGTTPEVAHPIAVAHYVRSLLPGLRHGEDTIIVALLHDVREDYDITDEEIRAKFGPRAADAVEKVTKTFRGVRRDDTALFAAIATCPVASVVKAADRINNQATMLGVFTAEKMTGYMDETERLFLPMLKAARRAFPDQEPAYENAKLVLTGQIELLRAVVDATR